MRISHFFIDRPIFASVVSIVFVIMGAVAFTRLPVAQYPDIVPPVINVSGQYPGANAEVVASTVVAPIEEQINGVENMLYMSSNSNGDGRFSIGVTFDIGTNLDIAQVQVQNRVATALPRLPADVRNIGVTVAKASTDLMMVVHVLSPDKSRDALFISNYALLEIKDALTRVDGVGSIIVFGSRDYAMRVWLDPARLQSLNMTATDVTQALQGQNIQVASGILNQPPVDKAGAFQISVQTLGRLADPEQFADIVVKQTPERRGAAEGRRAGGTRRAGLFVELLSQPRHRRSPSPCSSGRAPMRSPRRRASAKPWREAAKRFPPGIKYDIVYDPTTFIQESVDAVMETILEAILLVVIVVVLFLQTWRAAIIPLVAIPVSLIGTFFLMAMFGFSLNNLSLFGLVLAVGIVVDDAIVVVENVERNIAAGLSPRDAARRSMEEVGAALVAIALVLCAVFIPSAFITGISGQFYRQFALTIAGATVISLIVSLTLSPALCALLLRPHGARAERWWERPLHRFFGWFNVGFDKLADGLWLACRACRALRGPHAGRLCRRHPVRPQRIRQDAARLHPVDGPRLSYRRGDLAAGRVAGTHRRGAAPHRRQGAEGAGRSRRGEHRRLLRRNLHQCAERGRGLPGARSVREARPESEPVRGRPSSARCSPRSPISRRPASSWSSRRRCRASAMPAASA